jgi:co-chaperonin GroES (HSP10)
MTQRRNISPATRFRPTKQHILLEPIWPPGKVGSIHIAPQHAEDRPEEASVVAIATGVKTDARIGDRVLTDRFAGRWIEIGSAKYRIVEPDALLAVLEEACDEPEATVV